MNRSERSIIKERIHKCSHYLLCENDKRFLEELEILKFFLGKTELVIR